MNKGLEELKDIKHKLSELEFVLNHNNQERASYISEEKWNIIEKELRALEIITYKGVNVGYLKDAWKHNKKVKYDEDLIISTDTMRLLACAKDSTALTKAEYELLREVLFDENHLIKKKIKDITIGELNATCRKMGEHCENCPLKKACDFFIYATSMELKEEEIEVPERELK